MVQLPKLDTKKSEEGRWVEYVPGISVLIARSRNRKALDMMAKLGQRSLRRIQSGSTEALDSITKQVVAHTIIRGWRGMTDDDGADIPYSPEKALEIISDPRYADFLEFVQTEAGLDDEYRASDMEEAAGN